MAVRERSLLLAVCAFAFAARVQSASMEESQEPAEPADVVGDVQFETSCDEEVQEDFNKAVALLHSFEFDEARQMFEGIASRDPECSMAHWGVAMTHYNQWDPPAEEALKLGSEAVSRARSLEATDREKLYIEATGAFFDDWENTTQEERATRFERAMAELHEKFPDDEEAEIFYALVMLSGADPRDKTYAVQKRTGAMLESLFADMPNHPGVAHYIIHSYDYPSLAERAVDAAHRYLDIATSMPHALHMSGHIFTQVGMWEDCIDANVRSAEAARERFERTGLAYYKGDEIHAYDYLVYAYLQRGQDEKARAIVEHVQSRTDLDWTDPTNAFNAGAVPARYALERRDWEGAASLEPFLVGEKVEGRSARMSAPLRYWARAIGAARSGRIEQAENDLAELEKRTKEFESHETVWARHTAEVLRLQPNAWLALAKDEKDRALELITAAAELESQTDKSPVSPGRVLPAHEQLGDMLAELDRPEEALPAYETSMRAAPRRFNTYLGAARAAKDAGKPELARDYYAKLLELASEDSTRPALDEARAAGGEKTAG